MRRKHNPSKVFEEVTAGEKIKKEDYKYWGKNLYLDRLYEHLANLNENISLEQLLNDISMTEDAFFGSAHHGFSKKSTDKQRPLTLAIVRNLYVICSINPEDFLVKEREAEFDGTDGLFISNYWEYLKEQVPDAPLSLPLEKLLLVGRLHGYNVRMNKILEGLQDKESRLLKNAPEANKPVSPGL